MEDSLFFVPALCLSPPQHCPECLEVYCRVGCKVTHQSGREPACTAGTTGTRVGSSRLWPPGVVDMRLEKV